MTSTRFVLIAALAVVLIPFLTVSDARAQQGGGSKLGQAEQLVKQHLETVRGEYDSFETYGRNVAQRAVQDSRGGSAFGKQAAKRHPWSQSGNMNSSIDYFLDSFFNLDSRIFNIMNWSQAWSCFEPKLLAKAQDGLVLVSVAGPGNEDLIAECRAKCPHSFNPAMPLYVPNNPFIGPIIYHGYGCPDPDGMGFLRNGYEVVEYWYPEYQVSVNNFGINRIRPESLSPTGAMYTRQALLGQKQGSEQQELQQLASSYPLDMSNYEPNPNRQDPMKGQGVWGGYAFPDFEDKGYGHIVRTWLSTTQGDKKKFTLNGWQVDGDSVYDALPKRSMDHDPVNVWTEFGMFDVLTSIPQFSYKVRPDIMNALFGAQEPYTTKAKAPQPFWQSQGAMAYRVGKWGSSFSPLQNTLQVQPAAGDPALMESVYKGGHELFPLVTNLAGFGTPTISTAAIIARRSLYIAGANKQNGDQSGEIAGFFPQGEQMGRIMTYTIHNNKFQEIDKMQMISPKREKGTSSYGGVPPMVSECFRSQNIPNLVNEDQSLQKWIDKFLPRKLPGYYSDIDLLSMQGGDITFTYWNRRIGCFCDRCGLPFGSTEINDGGNGDKLYDKPRESFCRYPLFPQMTPWSSWAKTETFPQCLANMNNEGFYDGRGLRDAQ